MPSPPKCYIPTFRPEDFDNRYICRDDSSEELDRLVRQLAPHNIACLMPGAECGVLLADRLSERLGVLSNGTALSPARRDKYLMVEALRKAGLRVACSFKTKDICELIGFAKKVGWPIVVKPPASAGTDSVFICRTEEEVHQAYNAIVGVTNFMGGVNEAVLAQEFLCGTEYIVNAVRDHGRTVITKFLKYKKNLVGDAHFIYDRDELLSGCGETERLLSLYLEDVLDALGIRFGPAHAEIMVDERGPVLVEVGARVDGLTNPVLEKRLIGYGQIGLSLDTYLSADRPALDDLPACYETDMHHFVVHLISQQAGTIKRIDPIKEETIRTLSSFAGHRFKPCAGDNLTFTRDLFSSPGEVHLVHEDPEVIERDYRQIRDLEKNGLFLLEQT
jgi:biotin carboxylase